LNTLKTLTRGTLNPEPRKLCAEVERVTGDKEAASRRVQRQATLNPDP